MKRSLKNIIMIIVLIFMCGLVIFTMNCAKEHSSSKNKISNVNDSETFKYKLPSDLNESSQNNDLKEEKTDDNSNMKEPPEKPEGDSNMEEPPENPDGDNSVPNEMPSNDSAKGEPFVMNGSSSISLIYYILFALEGLVISSIVMYLIMSNFNKKTFKETFVNKDKVMINILSIIILTSGLTYLSSKVTSDCLLNNKDDVKNNMQNSSKVDYSSQNEITEDTEISEGEFESTKEDENTILVNGDIDVSISNVAVNKTGSSFGGDNTSFYGMNSAVLAKGGANLTLKNITVITSAAGANGVFSYGGSLSNDSSSGDGTTITISDSKIITNADNSGGIMTTGGGIMNAYNLDIETSGTSSAAIRTDRGGGVVTVSVGTYKTKGQGSPTIYSTADVTVNDATLTSEASEGIVIEGKNSVTINNCTLTDTNNKLNGQSTTYKNIFLYQSMSGDALLGTASFTSTNSKIVTNKGDTLYVTNTKATINLTNNTIINNDKTGNFLRVKEDSWGNSGSNGGKVTLNMTNQNAIGNIVIDSISTLFMNLKENSYYEGTINGDSSAKEIDLVLDSTSKIKLTGDSYVTSLTNSDSSNSNINFNGYKLYVNGKSIN